MSLVDMRVGEAIWPQQKARAWQSKQQEPLAVGVWTPGGRQTHARHHLWCQVQMVSADGARELMHHQRAPTLGG